MNRNAHGVPTPHTLLRVRAEVLYRAACTDYVRNKGEAVLLTVDQLREVCALAGVDTEQVEREVLAEAGGSQ